MTAQYSHIGERRQLFAWFLLLNCFLFQAYSFSGHQFKLSSKLSGVSEKSHFSKLSRQFDLYHGSFPVQNKSKLGTQILAKEDAEEESQLEESKKLSPLQKVTKILQTPFTIELPFGITFKGIAIYFSGIISGLVLGVVTIVTSPEFITTQGEVSRGVTLFSNALTTLSTSYVDEVDVKRLTETAISSMMKTLDPYTEFENTADAQQLQEMVSGRYGGVGLVIAGQTAKGKEIMMRTDGVDEAKIEKAEKITVVDAFEGYSFEKGLRVGDSILAVDGIPVKGKTVEEVKDLLRGTPGSEVTIRYTRNVKSFPKEGLEVKITRKLVRIPDVKLFTLLDPKIVGEKGFPVGYINLKSFSQSAGREVELAYRILAERAQTNGGKMRAVILDLRGNPGGLLDSAVDVASLFVPKESTIVSVRGRNFPETAFISSVEPIRPLNQPLIILTDGGTASAAEIVSGAVQDLDAGVVIGTGRTFGKGLVQNVEELPYQSSMKYTTAKYYTPSGRCIQAFNYEEGGFGEDLEVEGGSKKQQGPVPYFKSSKIKDEDRKDFKTKNQRIFRDGGGIEPDITVENPKTGPLEVALYANGIFFDYAEKWASENSELPENLEVVSPKVYQDFKEFVVSRQKSGKLSVEDIYGPELKNLEAALKESGYKAADEEVINVRQLIADAMLDEFDTFSSSIKSRLEQSILSRYLPESMLLKKTLYSDNLMKEAVELAKKKSRYTSLLAPPLSASEQAVVDSLQQQLQKQLSMN